MSCSNGQVPENISVSDEAFDKELKSLLQFTVPLMTVDELAQKLDDDILILDAREKEEFETSHIPSAQLIGYKKWDKKKMKNIDRSTQIVLYCSVGYRSEKIGEKLIDMGFENVYNLYGSIFEWVNTGRPVISSDQEKEVSQVHTYDKKWSQWVSNNSVKKVY